MQIVSKANIIIEEMMAVLSKLTVFFLSFLFCCLSLKIKIDLFFKIEGFIIIKNIPNFVSVLYI